MRDIEIRFHELRKDKGLKQKDIAKVLNMLEDTYSKCERSINDISLYNCNKLANFYNVSFDYILGLTNINKNTIRKEININLFCKRLKELRKENNLTQTSLSKSIGFRQNTYANYENGKVIPTTLKVYYISIHYNVSVDYLLGRSDNKKIETEKVSN